ncbi:MAG: hypothetical protein ABR606_06750 [Vicinamibacterales bacterium]
MTAATGLVIAGGLAFPALEHVREAPPPPRPPFRLSLPLPTGLDLDVAQDYPFGLAFAADGRRAVYPASRNGEAALWLHDLTTGSAKALPGTDAGLLPFWSADSTRVAFFSRQRLRILDLSSGRVDDLAEAPSPGGGAWLPSGDLIVAPRLDHGLARYRAVDGTLSTLTELDGAAGERSHRLPVVTGNGAYVVFYVVADRATRAGIWLAPVDRPTGRVRLTGSDGHGVVAGDTLLYPVDGSLVGQPLDLATRALSGRPTLVATTVGVSAHHQLFASAGAEALAYAEAAPGARALTWTDRTGRAIGELAGPVHAWDVRISPDARAVAVTATDPQLGTLDIWLYDDGRLLPRRASPAHDVDDHPVWAPDATRLAWVSGRSTVIVRGRQAMLPEDRVWRSDSRIRLWDWSGPRALIMGVASETMREDLYRLDTAGDTAPVPYLRSPFNETSAAISPDGRWTAYASDESGRSEIYVDRFPEPSSRVRLTADGGADPRWRGDGREIVFRRGDALYAVQLSPQNDSLQATGTSRLFDAGPDLRAYDMTRDGRRFVLNRPVKGQPPIIRIVVNWRTAEGNRD